MGSSPLLVEKHDPDSGLSSAVWLEFPDCDPDPFWTRRGHLKSGVLRAQPRTDLLITSVCVTPACEDHEFSSGLGEKYGLV